MNHKSEEEINSVKSQPLNNSDIILANNEHNQ